MANAGIDQNSRATLTALSSTGDGSIVTLYANPTTHRLLVDLSSGSGSVTSVSVVSANGFAGTVATPTTTPAITLTTTITGILKGNATAISAAVAGTDYEVPLTFSTGLTRTTNTITVNTSQNIATLSNLTSNGLVTTSGSTGALSVTVPGTGVLTALAVAVGSAGAFVTFNGALGTPSSGTLTNCTFPTLNQNTSGTSAGLTGTPSITVATVTTTGNIELGNASDTTLSRSSAGVLAVEGVVIPSISSTNTLTNKRITKRTGTTTSSATPTINTDNVDEYYITAQTVDITSFTTNFSGTPTLGQQLFISVIGTAARAITWGASFANGPVALPTTTVTTTQLSVLLKYDGTIWRCYASGSTV
jgi:hypothetical protein